MNVFMLHIINIKEEQVLSHANTNLMLRKYLILKSDGHVRAENNFENTIKP